MAGTQAVLYREASGVEPVDQFVDALPATRAAKIDEYIEEHLNGRSPDAAVDEQLDAIAVKLGRQFPAVETMMRDAATDI